ncbi:MAGE 2 [Labeo rohita]|uniref:MAGE 2 n=1 Tax=Labeo rohita TaxID=84645 RepID=A0A498N8V3_LABRO|nr:MAGE 2 [Labeo rohita]
MPAEPPKGAAVLSKTITTRKRRLAEHKSMPVSATHGSPLPCKTSKVVPVYSGTIHVTKSSPQQRTNPKITEQHRQKRREQWRQQQRQRRQQKASMTITVTELMCANDSSVLLEL